MVKRKQHIGMFLHNEMGVSWGGMSLMCGRSSIHPQKIFFLRSIGVDGEERVEREVCNTMSWRVAGRDDWLGMMHHAVASRDSWHADLTIRSQSCSVYAR